MRRIAFMYFFFGLLYPFCYVSGEDTSVVTLTDFAIGVGDNSGWYQDFGPCWRHFTTDDSIHDCKLQ